MNWKSKNQFLTSLPCSGWLTSLFKSTNQPCCCQSTCSELLAIAYSVYVQELAVWSLSCIWEASTKNECFSSDLLQVSALYLIFALPFTTVADGISYLTRIHTHSSCQKCLKNLYLPQVQSHQNGHFLLIRKSFLLRKFPAIRYMPYSLIP